MIWEGAKFLGRTIHLYVVLFISKCVGNFLNQSDWQNIFFFFMRKIFTYLSKTPLPLRIRMFFTCAEKFQYLRFSLNLTTWHISNFGLKVLWNHWNSSIWWKIFYSVDLTKSNSKKMLYISRFERNHNYGLIKNLATSSLFNYFQSLNEDITIWWC